MLESKLRKAAQAIIKNNSLLITSGTGMAVESKVLSYPDWVPADGSYKIPYLRGTYGLWKHFPAMKRNLISFDEFITEDFFKDNPERFWYVYGNLFQKYARSVPHSGYERLTDIIKMA